MNYKTLIVKTVITGNWNGTTTITGSKPVTGGSATMLMESVKRLRWLSETVSSNGTLGYRDMLRYAEKEERTASLERACKRAILCWLKSVHQEFQENTYFPALNDWTVRELVIFYDDARELISKADTYPQDLNDVDKFIAGLDI